MKERELHAHDDRMFYMIQHIQRILDMEGEGKQARDVFVEMWHNNGQHPGPLIQKRFQLLNPEDPHALAAYWGYDRAKLLKAKTPATSTGRRLTSEQLWPELLPLVEEVVSEHAAHLRNWVLELLRDRDEPPPPPPGRLY